MFKTRIGQLGITPFWLLPILFVLVGTSPANDCTLPLFGAPWHFSNGTTTVRTAIADFNNDGNPDVAATAHDAGFVGIFIGNGDGSFVRQTVLSAGNFDVPVSAGDFNNDGKQDLAVGSRDGTVWIYLGLGNGNFSAPNRYADGPGEAYEMAVADFNQDGNLDLAIGHQGAGLAVMIGNGSGGFAWTNTYLSGLGPVKVVTADFNNDGKADLITANQHSQTETVLLGDGAGGFTVTFTTATSFNDAYSNSGFAVGDFNLDGHTDFATSGTGTSLVVFYGNGQGAFPNSTTFVSAANNFPYAADMDGDGNPDIVAASHSNSIGSIIFGNGTGGFGSPTSFPVGNAPQTLSVADLNNDGKPDLITPNFSGADITVSINNGLGSQDTSAPVVSSAPNITTIANVPGGANIVYPVVAFDNSGITPTLDCNISPNSFFPIGTTTVTCAAVDACNNRSAEFSFNVTVECPAPYDLSAIHNFTVSTTNPAGTAVSYDFSFPVATPLSCDHPSGSNFPIGDTLVMCSATTLCDVSTSKSFTVTVLAPDCGGCPAPSFSVPTTFSAGGSTGYIVSADLNEDGYPDLVTSGPRDIYSDSGPVNILLNTGNGSFGAPIAIDISGKGIAVADFNRDNHLDLVVADSANGSLTIFYGTGTGQFGSPEYNYSVGGWGWGTGNLASGDFNGDGIPDVVAGFVAFGNWPGAVFLGNGVGLTDNPITFSGDPWSDQLSVVTADFSGDGKLDFLIDHQGLPLLGFGNGQGGFSTQAFSVGGYVAAGDFNGDGKDDLVGSDGRLFFSDGTTLNQAQSYPLNASAVKVADVNGDGKLDIVSNKGVMPGNGAGNFGFLESFPSSVADSANDLTVADFNHDGSPDVAIIQPDGNVAILFNTNWQDTASPIIFVSDINADATSSAGASVSYSVSAIDNSGTVPVNCSVPSGSTFPIGTTSVNCTATDASGNTATRAFNVTVLDLPRIVMSGASTVTSNPSGGVVNYSVSASDFAHGSLSVTCSPASGSNFPVGQTEVSCSAANLGGTTTRHFYVNVSLDWCDGCTPSFAPPTSCPLPYWGNYDTKMEVGDFNGDHKPDIALLPGTDTTWSVYIFMNDGAGGIEFWAEFQRASSFAVADLDHDGYDDFAMDQDQVHRLHVWYGDAAGDIERHQQVGGAQYPWVVPCDLMTIIGCHNVFNWEMISGDFNHDGKPDVFTGNDIRALAYLGDGYAMSNTPSYTGTGPFPGRWGWFGLDSADFNGDGNIDILSPNQVIYFGTGTGSFNPVGIGPYYGTGSGNILFTVGDFNGDGKPDIANHNVDVFLNNGSGGFTPAGHYDVGTNQSFPGFDPVTAWDIKNADMNGDGYLDLITIGGDKISILLGRGDGTFGSLTTLPGAISYPGQRMVIADFNGDGKPDIATSESDGVWDPSRPHPPSNSLLKVFLNTTYQTPVGTGSSVVINNTTFTFDNVTSGGTTTVTPIDPALIGEVPGGFAVSNSVAYEIATTATFTGSVTLAFKVPGPISQADFNNLAILHNENGTLVDVTASTPARDYATLTIYARTSSFSPFYLARKGPHVKSLFDQTKAYKSGSTIPIKLQMLDASNANVSSANTALVTRDLRFISGNTAAPVTDAGNANPDYAFRYDSTLGGAGGGYIFNLKTKELSPGQYLLSFYAGTDHSFFYTVKFEVK